ncbi:NB-ARC domain-containing protein [Asanoa sp. NPDC049573]|uniref:ATP-binding protein n=1 Tax=Asanoa sp. NPDC049573 TaxID=3155396 RepID=UPI003438931F
MRGRGGLLRAALASTLLSVLLAVAVNVATGGTLPAPLAPLAPYAWVVVALAAGVTVVVGLRDARPDDPPALVRPPAELLAAGGYTGRAADLARLRRLVEDGHPVVVVTGAPGVGKSALAAHAAHALRRRYPDGQLFAALGGGSGLLADPATVLADLLDALGAPVAGPTDVERLAARYRSVLAGRRVLVLLDDARDAAQVRPLLPGAAGCLVLVTSRSALADLAGAVAHELAMLGDDDALALLRAAGAGRRVDAEPDAARDVVAACGALPLALQIAGGRLRARPAWTLGDLATRLRDERARLDELTVGDLGVRASFATAYRDLPEEQRAAFRTLGAYPGRDLAAGAAAALTGDASMMERLVDARLVEATAGGRYDLHDLMRLFARERLAETPGAAAPALRRLVDWYAGMLAGATLPEAEAEAENVALTVRHLVDHGAPAEAARLATAADESLLQRVEQPHFLTIARDRLRADEATGDPVAIAKALTRLGQVENAFGYVATGVELLTDALGRWTAIGDPDWLAFTRQGLGVALRDAGRHGVAFDLLSAARAHYAAVGDQRREVQVLGDLGSLMLSRDEAGEAVTLLERARALSATAPLQVHEKAWVLLTLGLAYSLTGRVAEAVPLVEQARADFHTPANWSGEGYALTALGDLAAAAGDHPTALRWHAEALAAFDRVDHRPGMAHAEEAKAHTQRHSGDAAAAAATYGRAAEIYGALGNRAGQGLDLLWQAEQLIALDRHAEADAAVERADALLAGADLPIAALVRARLRSLRE